MPVLSIYSQERLSKLRSLHYTMLNSAETMNLNSPTTYTVCLVDVVKFGINLYNLQLLYTI